MFSIISYKMWEENGHIFFKFLITDNKSNIPMSYTVRLTPTVDGPVILCIDDFISNNMAEEKYTCPAICILEALKIYEKMKDDKNADRNQP